MMKLLLLSTILSSTAASSGILQQIQDFQHERRVQTTTDPCETTSGELLYVQSFYDGSLGQCTCASSNDLEGLQDGFDQESLGDPTTNSNFWTDIVTLVNDLLRSLEYEYSNSCDQVDCETCFGPLCGTITASEKIIVEGKSDTNLTLTDIFTLPGLQDALSGGEDGAEEISGEEVAEANAENATAFLNLFGPSLFTQNILKYCMAFTTELSGEACLEIDTKLDGEILTTFSSEPQVCTLGFNGQTCDTCQITFSTETDTCVKADCTGVAGVESMVDTCAGTGVSGPFQFLDGSAQYTSTCGETTVVTACEGTGCPPTISETDESGAFSSVVSFAAAGVAGVVALMMM